MTRRTILIGFLMLCAGYLVTTLDAFDALFASSGDGEVKATPCWFSPAPGWSADCYRLKTPENRQVETDRKVQLPVVMLQSTVPGKKRPPVIHIMGGPGQPSGIATQADLDLWSSYLSSTAWSLNRDHILYDARGVGPLTDPELRCALLSDTNWAEELDALEIGSTAWQTALEKGVTFCRDGFLATGVDLTAFNTVEAAADLVSLRKGLKIAKWTPYGVSYGTRVALQLMRIDPDGLESVILDSTHPLHIRGWADSLPVLNGKIEDLFDACRDDQDCNKTYGPLKPVFERVVTQMNETPVPMTVKSDAGDKKISFNADGDDLLAVVEYGLLMSEWLPFLPLLLDQINNGDYQLFKLAASQILFDSYYDGDANGLTYSTQCREEMPFNPPEAFASAREAHPLLAGFDLEKPLRVACDLWGAGIVESDFRTAVESDVPTLLISGEYDPRTPYEWSMDQASHLANGYFVLLSNEGHGPSVYNACAQAAMAAFLDAPMEYIAPSCLNRQPDPVFITDPGPPDAIL